MSTKQASTADPIRVLTPDDTEAVVSLWEDTFPPVEPRIDAIEAAADPDNSFWYGAAYEKPDAGLVGFGCMTEASDPSEFFGLPGDIYDPLDEPSAAFYMTCIHPDHREEDIGSALGWNRVEVARSAGYPRVAGIAWGYGVEIYDNLDFEQVGAVQGYYDYDPGDITIWRRWL